MKNKIISIIFLIFGILLCCYDFVILALCPGTFLDNLISFTHIWFAFGAYFIFLSVFRFKKKVGFWKTVNKKIRITYYSLILLAVVMGSITLGFILTPKTTALSETSDYLILLGGGIDKNGNLPSGVKKRVEKSAEYLLLHPETTCVVTGGTVNWLPYAEAPAIKKELEKAGIESERILLEPQAVDTIQNFKFSCKVLAENFEKSEQEILESKIVVVTNYFHLRRAERLAARIGYKNIKGIACPTPLIKIPNSYLREICAYLKLNLRIMFTHF